MPDWFGRRSERLPPKPSIKADRGSVAAETISNSPITFSLDEEGVRRLLQEDRRVLKEELVRIAGEKGPLNDVDFIF
jgi:hypothetical protein